MSERVPCRECDSSILVATADRTGGLCMPCKQGTRESIESAKKHYAEQKKYDPFRELWKSLVQRVYHTEMGYSGLTTDERTYFVVSLLDKEVYNGGLPQFFTNSSGEHFEDACSGLRVLGAHKSLELLLRAKELLYGTMTIPAEQHERNRIIRDIPDSVADPEAEWVAELNDLHSRYYEDPDSIGDRLDSFARARAMLGPFERKA